ncbi:hypothetical protein SAMD00024442_63_4 [Candidatus Symbiothrix dinenymphae]|nr:hypothetical protein SAMD00024442_63_4 [Candidatus Symbiothrix dinenymphae]
MPTYNVHLSDVAETDLQNIVSYVTDVDSWEQAKYVERGILETIKQVSTFPTAYPKDEYASTDTREIRFVMKWKYKILFFVGTETVQVIGIFHTAQNPDKLTFYRL